MGERGSTGRNIARATLGVLTILCLAAPAHASVEISTEPTSNMSCSGGVCSPTDKKAVLNVNDLTNMLAAGDVKVTTGAGAITITVSAPFSWTSTSRLTLDAFQNVSFKAPVTVAGTGAVTITYNDGGTGGDPIFFPGASLNFWDTSSSLIINGSSYALVDSLPNLIALANASPSGFYALSKNCRGKRTYQASPIKTFSGTFDGLGHAIFKFTLNSTSTKNGDHPAGLFGTSSGTLRNIGMVSESITTMHAAGGLVGVNEGTISESYTSGSVQGGSLEDKHMSFIHVGTGGLTSWNQGTIQSSYSDASVTGKWFVGGLVGFNSGQISQAHATGTVDGASDGDGDPTYPGGLVGNNWTYPPPHLATISQSYSTGAVSGNYAGYAGFVNENTGTISLSHNDSSTGEAFVLANGGAISQSYSTAPGPFVLANSDGGSVIQSYATGAVKGDYGEGGFVLANYGQISQAYSIGAVPDTDRNGGFAGSDYTQYGAQITSSYWDFDTSGIGDPSKGCGDSQNCPGVTGLTDAQLKSGLPAGFDSKIWAIDPSINNGYPYLLANPPPPQ